MENTNKHFLKAHKKILIAAALIGIIIISIICYNNYQKPERNGISFKKHSNGYSVIEYTGDDSLLVIPSEINGIPVTRIEGEVFYQCEKLRAVEIPESVTYIGKKAFAECTNLKSIEIPRNLTLIGDWAFSGCSNLSEIVFLDFWGERALKEIGHSAFSECQNLETITIPSQLEILGDYAFSDCKKLKTVNFEAKSQLKRIKGGAFSDCSALVNISIPLSVEYIGPYAFSGCDQLETIEIIPIEGWVILHEGSLAIAASPESPVPLEVLQDPSKTAYYLAGDFSKYTWKRNV